MERPWLKFYEPGVPASIPYPDIPLHQNLADAAKDYPNSPATIFFDAVLTYQELDALADRFAAELQQMGVKKGDRVAIYLPNCPQFIIAYYGTLRAGGIVAPCNPLYVARELEHQLNDSGSETIVVLSKLYPVVKAIRDRTPLKRVIVTSIKEYFPPILRFMFTLLKEKKEGHAVDISKDPNTIWFKDFLRAAPAKPQPVPITPQDTACLLYTGGTTGVPKAAELSHRNLVANAVQCAVWCSGRRGQEKFLAALPLFHSYGMTTCMNAGIYMASPVILLPQFKLKDVLEAINKHQPTIFPGVPTMYVAINNYPEIKDYNLRSIRACISGAAGLPVEVQQKFQELTGGRLVEGYGLSEASPVTHGNPVFGDCRIGTIGVPFPDTDAKIVDLETGTRELPPGEAGELIIKGPQVMKGYWNRPDETALVLREGWLYTGDIARRDADGYFQIVDRKKDMIIAGGFNIYPRDVEEVLYQHPKVKEAVVTGVPDEYLGEVVKAYIVLKEGETATEQEIIEFCRQNLAKYKVPRIVEFRKELPKTMVGKILRRVLVEEERAKMAKAKQQ
ncbi:MAG: long-chain fatty acid--CoA ligase [Anaerolineae bacterium]|nr:long-chain fatty acid--CoA ligase [Anaerolineae bacterium]